MAAGENENLRSIGWIGVPWSPAESVIRMWGDDLATRNTRSVPWLEQRAVPPPCAGGLSPNWRPNHPGRRRICKVFRGLR
jgi:hypothetical protein